MVIARIHLIAGVARLTLTLRSKPLPLQNDDQARDGWELDAIPLGVLLSNGNDC